MAAFGRGLVATVMAMAACGPSGSFAQSIEASAPAAGNLPPVEAFFTPAAYSDLQLSPDGKLLSALVPINGRRNLALIDLERHTALALTALKDEEIAGYQWVGDRLIEFSAGNLQDELGNVQIRHRVLVDTDGHVVRDLLRAASKAVAGRATIGGQYQFMLIDSVGRTGDDLVVATNERNQYAFDAYRYNPRTSEKALLTFKSPGDAVGYLTDHAGQVRIAMTIPKGAEKSAWWSRRSNDDDWTKVVEADIEQERMRPLGFDFDDRTFYVAVASPDGERTRVHTYDLDRHELGAQVFESDTDVGAPVVDRVRRRVVGFHDGSPAGIRWTDPEWDRLQRSVDAALPGQRNRLRWGAYSTDRVVVTSDAQDHAAVFYLLDRQTSKLERVAVARPMLASTTLGARTFVRYRARDGLSIPAFLTLPAGETERKEVRKLPLVVIVHGGPYVGATAYGFSEQAHFLASRGYAVLQPDYRGTHGYGDAFYKAGWRQWGLAMQDDVTDGVDWLVREGRVDPDRVCLFGASYGGYATLWGLEKEPAKFRCGVAFVAVSNLESMFDVTWSDFMQGERGGDTTRTLTRWIGDPDRDRDKLRAVSPVFHTDRLQAPLLLAYGAADERVPLTHGQQMKSALDRDHKPYEWVVYDGEAHGFNKDANRFDFYRRVDAFLAKNLAPRAGAVASQDRPADAAH